MSQMIYSLHATRLEKPWGYEDWILSTHPSAPSTICKMSDEVKNDGENFKSQNFANFVRKQQWTDKSGHFPILVKYLHAKEQLSLQVHPDDNFVRQNVNINQNIPNNGKSECWYILDASKNAKVSWGFSQEITQENLKKNLEKKELPKELREVPVCKGDFIYVPAGTVHAIGGGISLLEVQQNSDITYRLHDYKLDRELHLEEGLKVANLDGQSPNVLKDFHHYFRCEHFCVEKKTIEPENTKSESVASKNLLDINDNNQWIMLFCIDEPISISFNGKLKHLQKTR